MNDQFRRLLGATVAGPLMIWGGIRLSGKGQSQNQPWSGLLTLLGTATVLLDARAFLVHRDGGALPGGRGDHLDPASVNPAELAEGTRVEMEHTTDPAIAREIALDHLAEDPAYYTHLRAIETHA